MILPPTSEIGHHHNDVTNITVIDHLEKNDFDHKNVIFMKNGNFIEKR